MTTATWPPPTSPWPAPNPAARYVSIVPVDWRTWHYSTSNPLAAVTARPDAELRRIATERSPNPTGWLLLAILTALMFAATFIGFFAGRASALPLCGGNQKIQTAPLTCTNTRTIDGTAFTTVLDVAADGTATVTYTLDAPRPADTPIRVRAHRGISSNGNTIETSGVIPATVTTATLGFRINCGQVDIKAVFTGNGDARGRVSAPFVTYGDNCATTPTNTTTTTPASTTTTVTTVTTTTVGTTTPGQATSTTPQTAPSSLPATGGGPGVPVGYAIAGALVVGLGLVLLSRRHADA